MKRFFALLLFSISLFPLFAQTNSSMNVVATLYYDRNVYIASDVERAKLNNLIAEMQADSTIKIHIIGYGDKWGGEEVNDRFSYIRAKYIADWIHSHRVPREQIAYVGEGIDTKVLNDAEARRVEVLQIVKVIVAPQSQPKTEDVKVLPKSTPAAEATNTATTKPIEKVDAVQVEPQTTMISEHDTKQNNFTLRTNLLYWVGGVMNVGFEFKQPHSNFGFVLNGGYSFFGDTHWSRNMGGWFVAPEVRYYLPCNEQWFVGAQLLAAGYNVKLSDTGRQGTVLGGGIMGGYKLTLTNSFDMDFTLGVGYGHFKYDTYNHDKPTDTNPRIEKDVVKNSIMPIQAGVNLIWKIK
ncbi:MAG: DUF3575 domain-containing protein [Rikenellaceae bacterium]